MSAQVLYSLQEKDLLIAQRRREQAALEEELRDQSVLLQANQTLAQRQERLGGLRGAQKDRDLEAAQLRADIQEVEGRLYGGRVSNPRELQDMQANSRQLRGLLSTAEEDLLRLMMEVEEATQGMHGAEGSLRDLQAQRAEREAAIRQRQAQVAQELQALAGQRGALVAGVPKNELQLYQRLQTTKGGQAVARVEGGRCRGCNVAIPTQQFQRARAGRALVQCANCSRILFVG
ncbi:MAG: hypothetical protein EXR55_01415 [Dehalococcoidia bacterium]|nr:hypothetical protein [Dehalococcoidia bacterium]